MIRPFTVSLHSETSTGNSLTAQVLAALDQVTTVKTCEVPGAGVCTVDEALSLLANRTRIELITCTTKRLETCRIRAENDGPVTAYWPPLGHAAPGEHRDQTHRAAIQRRQDLGDHLLREAGAHADALFGVHGQAQYVRPPAEMLRDQIDLRGTCYLARRLLGDRLARLGELLAGHGIADAQFHDSGVMLRTRYETRRPDELNAFYHAVNELVRDCFAALC
ncbi:hypothetical protein [Sciscionella marina]|uniref:hypothetical protein n=1 Tax=Sciscionella marina TaxID=508770 RepID=UPI00036FD61F|nr:hypothetical protein [Sciscionella marina]